MVHQLIKFHVQRVDMVINPPWNLPFLGAKGLTSPEQTATVEMVFSQPWTCTFLVAKGLTTTELMANIKAIRLFLAYASFMGFMVYQMDVKSAFLYGRIEEEVYVCQPSGFEDPDYPNKVYKVVKELYGLHQALRAWYETLAKYLLDNRSTKKELCIKFKKLMHDKFQISSMGELTFFLGLQVKQKEYGIFFSQDKYVADILRKFSFTDFRTASTLMDIEMPLLKDSDGDDVDVHLYRDSSFKLVAYSDSDYARASLDRKSTIGGCQFLGCRLISWQCKKQTVVATSSTEAEYVAAASCCGQVLWIQNQMLDYGYALTENPTIYVSCIKQFWQTATARTLDNGEIELTATIDSKVKTIIEGSIRRHLQLADDDGISSLPTTEIFEQLSLMGPKKTSWEKFSSNIATAIICLATYKKFNFSKLIFDADEAASTGVDVRYGGATTTVIGFEAGQGSGNIYKTPTMPHDSPLPRVNTLRSDEGSMIQQELMVFCRTLSKKVESLKTNLKQTKQIYGATYTKHIKNVKSWRKQLSPAKLEEGQELLSLMMKMIWRILPNKGGR
ncbi:putative ribonuclease H-like domain-containing protein [Tanacetum coccineum]